MLIVVTKNKHTHDCTSQEQLDRFLAAGWVKAKKQPKLDDNAGDGTDGKVKEAPEA